MNDYARKYNILKENDKNLSGDDVREGLTVIISVKLKDAQFESQTKGRLGNMEMLSLVSSLVSDKLATYLEENPAAARAIFDKALAAARAREAARKARELVRRKSVLETPPCPASWQTARAATRRKQRFTSWRATLQGAPPRAGATGGSRRFFPFGAKC